MEERIITLFAAVLQIDPADVINTASPETIEGWDSLNHLNLIASFEEEFSIDVDPEEMPGMMQNFQAFKTVILEKME